ncbi:MAG: helix-turn-helix domain-containing protein [Clostridiales bacterium]|jgi:excisionase family DNA binding protein|nr:helix-turn-helix domain-containing protein [Clostridiales bacterium]
MNHYRQYSSEDELPIVFSLAEAAAILSTNVDRLRKNAQNGQFPAFRDGNLWKVRKVDFINWMADQVRSAYETA